MVEGDDAVVEGKVLGLKDGVKPYKRRRLTASVKRTDSGAGSGKGPT